MVKSNYRLAKPFVSKLPLFSFLSNKQKDAISYNMNTLKYREGEAIFKENDDASSFYIIISGLVEIQISGKDPIKFRNGDSFG
jgi:signal-transduction protein with cAMP-binding, CBS, and nucleotidyltransferase domain